MLTLIKDKALPNFPPIKGGAETFDATGNSFSSSENMEKLESDAARVERK